MLCSYYFFSVKSSFLLFVLSIYNFLDTGVLTIIALLIPPDFRIFTRRALNWFCSSEGQRHGFITVKNHSKWIRTRGIRLHSIRFTTWLYYSIADILRAKCFGDENSYYKLSCSATCTFVTVENLDGSTKSAVLGTSGKCDCCTPLRMTTTPQCSSPGEFPRHRTTDYYYYYNSL